MQNCYTNSHLENEKGKINEQETGDYDFSFDPEHDLELDEQQSFGLGDITNSVVNSFGSNSIHPANSSFQSASQHFRQSFQSKPRSNPLLLSENGQFAQSSSKPSYPGFNERAAGEQSFSKNRFKNNFTMPKPVPKRQYEILNAQAGPSNSKKMRNMESSIIHNSHVQQRERITDRTHSSNFGQKGLLGTNEVPLPFRNIFNFRSNTFNKMQSELFNDIMDDDENVVVTAPTGAGKTVLFELAFIRMVLKHKKGKAVYLAPTKSLCSERFRDWSTRFGRLEYKVLEMTGDSKVITLEEITEARLIVATPEKWDIVTRRAKPNDILMGNLHLFLLDEVHSVREDVRGALLEVIIARTKSRMPQARILAVSATIPNAEDVAKWIGSRKRNSQDNPKSRSLNPYIFSDDFRPCPLQKHVFGFSNFFRDTEHYKFEAKLNEEVPAIIEKFSNGKSTLIFCASRTGTEKLANHLFLECGKRENDGQSDSWPQSAGQGNLRFHNEDLQNFSEFGVAFHHAGLAIDDRRAVEKAFLEGELKFLCATTTLSVGINLPAYLVIVRGTKMYSQQWVEQSDLTILQMMGRAGRPQFDTEGVCVIMTEQDRQEYWETLLKGQSVIESTLHQNLVENINAEIASRTQGSKEYNIESWLKETFLFARMSKNWSHYNIEGCTEEQSPEEIIRHITKDTLKTLEEHEFLSDYDANNVENPFNASEYGNIMANYAIRFQTMIQLKNIPSGADMRVLIDAICEADEFSSLFLRKGERELYQKAIGQIQLRYPPLRIKTTSEKLSVLLQSSLAGVRLGEVFSREIRNLSTNPTIELMQILKSGPRIARAIFTIALHKNDGPLANEALKLFRSLSGNAWDDEGATLQQVDGIGSKIMDQMVNVGIRSIRDLTKSVAAELSLKLGQSPLQVQKLINQAKTVPFLFVEAKEVEATMESGGGVLCKIAVYISLQHKPSEMEKLRLQTKEGKALHISILGYSSNPEVSFEINTCKEDQIDQTLNSIDFFLQTELRYWRVSILNLLKKGQKIDIDLKLFSPDDEITVVCSIDDIAGSACTKRIRSRFFSSRFMNLNSNKQKIGNPSQGFRYEQPHQEQDRRVVASSSTNAISSSSMNTSMNTSGPNGQNGEEQNQTLRQNATQPLSTSKESHTSRAIGSVTNINETNKQSTDEAGNQSSSQSNKVVDPTNNQISIQTNDEIISQKDNQSEHQTVTQTMHGEQPRVENGESSEGTVKRETKKRRRLIPTAKEMKPEYDEKLKRIKKYYKNKKEPNPFENYAQHNSFQEMKPKEEDAEEGREKRKYKRKKPTSRLMKSRIAEMDKEIARIEEEEKHAEKAGVENGDAGVPEKEVVTQPKPKKKRVRKKKVEGEKFNGEKSSNQAEKVGEEAEKSQSRKSSEEPQTNVNEQSKKSSVPYCNQAIQTASQGSASSEEIPLAVLAFERRRENLISPFQQENFVEEALPYLADEEDLFIVKQEEEEDEHMSFASCFESVYDEDDLIEDLDEISDDDLEYIVHAQSQKLRNDENFNIYDLQDYVEHYGDHERDLLDYAIGNDNEEDEVFESRPRQID